MEKKIKILKKIYKQILKNKNNRVNIRIKKETSYDN